MEQSATQNVTIIRGFTPAFRLSGGTSSSSGARTSDLEHVFASFHSMHSLKPRCSMKCFVTGASGFIGANLVHELNARGHSVKALLRPNADVRGLTGAEFERVPGDV